MSCLYFPLLQEACPIMPAHCFRHIDSARIERCKSSNFRIYPQKYSLFLRTTRKINIFATDKNRSMDIIFNKEYLQVMYNTGKTDKKHRFQPQIIRKYIRVIDLMRDTSNVLELLRYNALNYEKLEGDKAGLSSVRVNDQYRIEFKEHTRDGETVATICNITDLSNHYK